MTLNGNCLTMCGIIFQRAADKQSRFFFFFVQQVSLSVISTCYLKKLMIWLYIIPYKPITDVYFIIIFSTDIIEL